MFKTLNEAVKAVGGEENALAIINRHLKQKVRDKENRALLSWAKEQKASGKVNTATK